MRKITLGTTYYNNPDLLNNFIKSHYEYVDHMIIVDDGSNIKAYDHIDKSLDKIRLYEVKKDYGFNSHGCRNLIVYESPTEWLVLMDSDRQFVEPEYAFEEIKTIPLNKNTRYKFIGLKCINNIPQPSSIHESVNEFLIHKDHFKSAVGYDEEIIGIRDGDRQFFKQLEHFGNEKTLFDIEYYLLRGPSIRLKDDTIKSKFDRSWTKELLELIDIRTKKPDIDKKVLTFDWERVI